MKQRGKEDFDIVRGGDEVFDNCKAVDDLERQLVRMR